MSAYSIYKEFEYPDTAIQESQFVSLAEHICPQTYPTLSHPSTLLVLKGKNGNPAIQSDFTLSRMTDQTREVVWCQHLDLRIVTFEIMASLA